MLGQNPNFWAKVHLILAANHCLNQVSRHILGHILSRINVGSPYRQVVANRIK